MSRNFNFKSDECRPHAKALGELALIWNDVHMKLSFLFWVITRIPNGLVADSIWHSIKSERAQRDMLKNLVQLDALNHTVSEALRVEVIWVLNELNKLADLRNDALHSPFLIFDDGAVLPWHQLGHSSAKKLKEKDVLRELEWFYRTADVLRQHIPVLADMHHRQNDPMPIRPALPNRGDFS
jgi:hypothetical protein